MITKMKKWTFMVYHREYTEFLEMIRELGVIHVRQKQAGVPDDQGLMERLRLVDRYRDTLRFLGSLEKPKDFSLDDLSSMSRSDRAEIGREVLSEVDSLREEQLAVAHELQTLSKEEETLAPWGDFDAAAPARLLEKGYEINFYICMEADFNPEWEKTYNAIEISRLGSKIHFVTVTRKDAMPRLDADMLKWPERSLSDIRLRDEALRARLREIDSRLVVLARRVDALRAVVDEVSAEVEFSKVVLSTDAVAEGRLMLLQGWTPADRADEIAAEIDKSDAYYEIEDPTPDDDVPILLNNNRFARLFEPILKLYMLPKYSEMDLTPYFAPFYMIFFGLCLGDSGYGLILFLGALLAKRLSKNMKESMKSVCSLVEVLGASTFFCGLLTGTFMGFSVYESNIPFFKSMGELFYNSPQKMFSLSLVLGLVQIIFGQCVKVANRAIQFGWKYSLSTVGWIMIIVSTVFASVCENIMPLGGTAHMVILAIGAALAFFTNSPDKNIFVNFGLGFWDAYNMATGLLGDVLSYVRLFALGLSGGILGAVFNSLATGMSPDNAVFGPIVMVLIFVAGHGINLFMNALGAMVHPMRLTFVEFFSNSGYEGGGKEYKPFKN